MATPKKWMEVFKQLTTAINNSQKSECIVLFFDELPWLATRRSGFLKALEHYWNTDWCYRKKIILMIRDQIK